MQHLLKSKCVRKCYPTLVGPGLWRNVLHLAIHWLIMYRPVVNPHLVLHMSKHC